MEWIVSPFETRFLDQLNLLPPPDWQSDAYNLFMHNEWQPWFYPYQVVENQKLVGFGMLFHFDDVVWLGWILVHKKYRKQGIGNAITQHLMNEGKRLGATRQVLTATELGYPIYEKLGFIITTHYLFFKAPERVKLFTDKAKFRKALPSDLYAISLLDQKATGENRRSLLENHLEDTTVYFDKEIEGFYISTLGTGLVIANTPEAGQQLSNYRLKRNNNSIVVPEQNKPFIASLLEQGYKETHKIPRMVLGDELNWKPEMIYNRAAGYCG